MFVGVNVAPVATWFERFTSEYHIIEFGAVAVNVGSYSGHNTLREQVLGNDFKREATPKEVEQMKSLLQG